MNLVRNNLEVNKINTKAYKILKILLYIFSFFLVLVLGLILFIRSSFGQNLIVDKAVNYLKEKTNTEISIDKLFITFDGDVLLKEFYLEDKKGDTLVFSEYLEIDVPLMPIISGKSIGVESVDWKGLKANIVRKDSINGYNFQFLIDAFVDPNAPKTPEDTTSTSTLDIIIGNLNFKDFDIEFNDAVLGIESAFKIGELNADFDKTDINTMDFRLSEIEIRDTDIKLYQSPVPETPSDPNAALPYLAIDELTFENISTHYKSVADQLDAKLKIQKLYTELPKIDLNNNHFVVDQFGLKQADITLKNGATKVEETATNSNTTQPTNFEWPTYIVEAKNLSIEDANLSYLVGDNLPKKNKFDPNAIVLEKFNFQSDLVLLKEEALDFKLNRLTFNEGSGFQLKNFETNVNVSNKKIAIDQLKLHLNDNKVYGNSQIKYSDLSKFINKPESAYLNLNLSKIQLDINEAIKFQPELAKNEYVVKLSENYVLGTVNASGQLSAIKISDTKFNWGESTSIQATGTLLNATQPKSLSYDFPEFRAETTQKDVYKFVNKDSLSVQIPKSVVLIGNVKGSTEKVETSTKITTTQGIANINGVIDMADTLTFDAVVSIENYQLDQLLKNSKLGGLSMEIKSKGSGATINELDATLQAKIIDFELNDYAITDLVINGEFKNGSGTINSDYKDDNLNIKLNSDIVLDSLNTQAKVDLNLIGANLSALGVMKRNVKTGLKLKAEFKGNPESYEATASIDDGVVVYDNTTYLLGSLDASAFVKQDTTSIVLKNKILDIDLQSNASPQIFSEALKDHLYSYFNTTPKPTETDTTVINTNKPVKLKLKGHLSQAPILNEVFLVNLNDVDTVGIDVNFDQKLKQLKAAIVAPHIDYSGSEIDSLSLFVNTNTDDLDFELAFNGITSAPIAIKKTKIKGSQTNGKMILDFLSFHENEKLIHINANFLKKEEELEFNINPENLILNKKQWNVPVSNKVSYTKDKLEFTDFKFDHGSQSLVFTHALPNIKKEHVALMFDGIKLSEFLNYLNPDEKLVRGNLNGNVVVENPFSDTGILADLKIEKLNLMDVDMGTLSLNAESLDNNRYDFKSNLKGGQVNLSLNGDYLANKNGSELNMDLVFDRFDMKALEGFTRGELTNTSGDFSGKFKIEGKLDAPKYKGNIKFNKAYFKVAKFNTGFTFVNEQLEIDNEGLKMDAFTVVDETKNKLILSGKVGTESLSNPTFDMKIKAKNFQVINAEKEDNELIYGKAIFGLNTTLTGDLDIPKLQGKITVNPDTNITYILPQSTANIEERDGIVQFVNRENPNAILTQTEEESVLLKGFDIDLKIDIDKFATAQVILDEDTGDNFQISGHGDLNLKMTPNGRLSLAGYYDVNKGHYEMNLYNLVKRKFEIVSGSSVIWSGNPLDAKLNVKALYNVKASASSLMAAQTSSTDPSIKGKFRQVLPFYVYLNIDGQLTQPELSFKIDMPEDDQGAIGGQVYGRIQQLNQQESELNKQIFSLLVLNRFYPEPGSDGSGGGAASIATSNLSDALSDQLNQFSDKILGDTGLELNFGLNSYTDYQSASPQDRTQLDIAAQKKLFNDRLTVSVGSEVDIQGSRASENSAPLVGNVTLEYLLTKNGKYRLKGFRKNEFENVIDGQTIVSGLALIFAQEFNKFDELWAAILRKESEKEAEKKAEKEKEQSKQKNKDQNEPDKDEIDTKNTKTKEND